MAQSSTEIHLLNGDHIVVHAAVERVLGELQTKPGAHGLSEISDGQAKVFLRGDQVACVRPAAPEDGSDETPL